jgi:hypothetical protein
LGLGGLRQLLEDDVMVTAFELGDEAFGDPFRVAFAEVAARAADRAARTRPSS